MENKGLLALEKLMTNYYEMCQDLGNNDDQYQRCNLTSERAIIEKELKAKANLVSMCENLAKLVGLKEKDCAELETLITKKLKAFKIINKRFGSFILTVIESVLRTSKEERDLLKEVLK